MAPNRK